MTTKRVLPLVAVLMLLSACEVRMAPSEYWSKLFRTQTDSNYYREKSESLVNQITKESGEYDINKVTVMDFVDEENQAPILGEYMSSRIVESLTRNRLFREKQFRITQKGEVNEVLNQLNLKPSYFYNQEELMRLGKALNSQALITGRITDLGTNIDIHLTLTDVHTGEVIASATENFTRTKFAVEMLRHH